MIALPNGFLALGAHNLKSLVAASTWVWRPQNQMPRGVRMSNYLVFLKYGDVMFTPLMHIHHSQLTITMPQLLQVCFCPLFISGWCLWYIKLKSVLQRCNNWSSNNICGCALFFIFYFFSKIAQVMCVKNITMIYSRVNLRT